MKKLLICCLTAVLALTPLLARAELTAFEPLLTQAVDAKALLSAEEGRLNVAMLLLMDCLGGEAVPDAACMPDYERGSLLSTGSTVCLLLSCGDRTLAVYYGLEARNAGWDAVDTPLTETLIRRLADSMGAEPWDLDMAELRGAVQGGGGE